MKLIRNEKNGRILCRSEQLDIQIETARGMDISRASFQGVEIGWLRPSALAPVEPGYDDQLQERSMFFGLLTTCGLENTGPSCGDGEEFFCRHGSINWNRAENVQIEFEEGLLVVKGSVPSLRFASPLVLHREIRLDGTLCRLSVTDRVENTGREREQLCLMYHYNFAAPFLSPACRISVPPSDVRAKNEAAARLMDERYAVSLPEESAQPLVYYHEYKDKELPVQRSYIENPALGLRVELLCHGHGLPMLDLWKDMRPERYVLSLEPCNAFPYGRIRQQEEGLAHYVAPGEIKEFKTEIVFMRI